MRGGGLNRGFPVVFFCPKCEDRLVIQHLLVIKYLDVLGNQYVFYFPSNNQIPFTLVPAERSLENKLHEYLRF